MTRKHFLAILFAAAMLAACGKAPQLAAVPPGAVVVAFGDSVTRGTGAAQDEDWPTLLGKRTGWHVVNAGVSGDTAEAGRNRIQALLDEHHPAMVIIEIGGNDFLRRRAPKAVKEDLRHIVASVRQAGAHPVLVGVPELSLLSVLAGSPTDSSIYGELAKEEQVPLVGDVLAGVLGRPDLRADRIHPNAAGYRKMAAGIAASLQQTGLSR
jgi:acyl-CoA hydrolase